MRRKVKGSYTVELAAIMPVILLALIICITLVFYFYDKCILTGMSAEIAVTAAEEIRNGKEDLSELDQEFQVQTEGRLIFLGRVELKTEKKGTDVIAHVQACKGVVRCEAYGAASVRKAEEYIRVRKEISKYED